MFLYYWVLTLDYTLQNLLMVFKKPFSGRKTKKQQSSNAEKFLLPFVHLTSLS